MKPFDPRSPVDPSHNAFPGDQSGASHADGAYEHGNEPSVGVYVDPPVVQPPALDEQQWQDPNGPDSYYDDADMMFRGGYDLDQETSASSVDPSNALQSGAGWLTVRDIGKSYRKRAVVKGVSLCLARGEAVGLLGPNGAGKTTVFYMISGLVRPDFGDIELDGQSITDYPMYRRARLGIGYLPQEASIFRGLSVEDNIMAVLEMVEPVRRRRREELDSLLEEFRISHLRKSAAIALSGGERRRLEIARALASRPGFVLLDEPFAGVDPIAVGDIQQLVHHLKLRGIGVLITDHNVRETLGLIDRAYIIHSGNVLKSGTPAEIVSDQDVRRLYLGEDFTL